MINRMKIVIHSLNTTIPLSLKPIEDRRDNDSEIGETL
jgi:hypothetical protein